MTFAHPWLLLLAPAVGLLAFADAWGRRRARAAAAGLRTTAGEASVWGAAAWPGLVLLAVAAAGPQLERAGEAAPAVGRDLVVVLDVSTSMLAEDISPNRLAAARAEVGGVLTRAEKAGGHRVGLVAVAAAATVVCPLTQDFDFLRQRLAGLDAGWLPTELQAGPAGSPSGTRLGAGVRAGLDALDPRFPGCGSLLVLSDGDDPAGDGEWRAGPRAVAAAEPRLGRVAVAVVGVGDPSADATVPGPDGRPLRLGDRAVRSRLQEEPLHGIAQGVGVYRRLGEGDPYADTLAAGRVRELRDDPVRPPRSVAVWFLAPAAVLLTAAAAWGRGVVV